VADYLRSVDPARQRTDRILRVLGVIAFYFLAISGALIAWAHWHGYV
jgi:hypothetical protein